MSDLIKSAQTGIEDAPSTGAAQAIEEMVSQTVVAGIQNLSGLIGRTMEQLEDNAGMEYLDSLPTAEHVAKLLSDWEGYSQHLNTEVERLNSLASEIGSFHKSAEVEAALTAALQSAQENRDKMAEHVEATKKRLEELIKKEEEEADQQMQEEQEGSGDGA